MTDLNVLNELFPTRVESTQLETSSAEDLGSDAFLELMVAQLENQDPSAPLDPGDFTAQLAQFGTVSGIQELNENFNALGASLNANQGWQAAALVGTGVVTDSNVGQLFETGEEGALSLKATVDFGAGGTGGQLYVQDLAGRLVYSAPLPGGVSGELPVEWNGLDIDGEPVAPGNYRVSAETIRDGQSIAIPVYTHQQVASVAIDSTSGQVSLNLSDGTTVSVDEVREFL